MYETLFIFLQICCYRLTSLAIPDFDLLSVKLFYWFIVSKIILLFLQNQKVFIRRNKSFNIKILLITRHLRKNNFMHQPICCLQESLEELGARSRLKKRSLTSLTESLDPESPQRTRSPRSLGLDADGVSLSNRLVGKLGRVNTSQLDFLE